MGQHLWTIEAKPGGNNSFSADEWLVIGWAVNEIRARQYIDEYKNKSAKIKGWPIQEFRLVSPEVAGI